MPLLEGIYRRVMDEALQKLGGNRGPVIFHLPPLVQQAVHGFIGMGLCGVVVRQLRSQVMQEQQRLLKRGEQ